MIGNMRRVFFGPRETWSNLISKLAKPQLGTTVQVLQDISLQFRRGDLKI